MKKFLICFWLVYKMILSDELLKMFLQCKFCYKTKLKAKKSKNSQKNTKHDAVRKQTENITCNKNMMQVTKTVTLFQRFEK